MANPLRLIKMLNNLARVINLNIVTMFNPCFVSFCGALASLFKVACADCFTGLRFAASGKCYADRVGVHLFAFFVNCKTVFVIVRKDHWFGVKHLLAPFVMCDVDTSLKGVKHASQ